MNFVNEYRNSNDKISFFRNLSATDQQRLYKEMNYTEQNELLFILPFQYTKTFILSFPKEEQKNIYKRLNEKQLTTIYNTLNEDVKKDMASSLETRQADLLERIDRHMENISQKKNDIVESQARIQESTIHIADTKIDLQNKMQELKKNKASLKKLEKERRKKLKKLLKSSRPSPLDRIGVISKYRTNKLLKRQTELEQTNDNITSMKDYKEFLNQSIHDAKDTIAREQQNIVDLQERMKQDRQSIQTNTKAVQKTECQIRKLSQTEKKLFGRKLYHHVLQERDAILINRKHSQVNREQLGTQNTSVEPARMQENQPMNGATQTVSQQSTPQAEAQVEEVTPVEVIDAPKINTQAQMNQLLSQALNLNGMGVNFYPPTGPVTPQPAANLLEDPITTLTRNQFIIATYAMIAIYNYQQLLEQQRKNQMDQNQNLSQGYTRTLEKGSRGVVSLTLLISILLLIFSLTLFFIK